MSACTACGTPLPEGAFRCIGCGRVFGEDNRCPSCNAVAAVVPAMGGFACAACGAPRQKKEGTVVLAGSTVLPAGGSLMQAVMSRGGAGGGAPARRGGSEIAARGTSTLLRFGGMGAIGVGVATGAMIAVLVPGAAGLAIAALMGALWIGLGALGLKAGAKVAAGADRREGTSRELAILELAEKSDGDLTATELARGLGISLKEADAALTAMVDEQSRVAAEVDPEGVVHYVFRELRASSPTAPRVRVDASIAPREVVEEAEAEAERASRTPAAQRRE